MNRDVVDVATLRRSSGVPTACISKFGEVHLLMNNAGVGGGGYLWESSDARLAVGDGRQSDGRCARSAALCSAHAGSERSAASSGHIVNTASMAGWLAAPLMGVYNVSKHAVVALSETLYPRLADSRSRRSACRVLSPAFVPTGIAESHRYRPAGLAERPCCGNRFAEEWRRTQPRRLCRAAGSPPSRWRR